MQTECFVSSNSYVEILTIMVMVRGGGAPLGNISQAQRWSPHEWDWCPSKKRQEAG